MIRSIRLSLAVSARSVSKDRWRPYGSRKASDSVPLNGIWLITWNAKLFASPFRITGGHRLPERLNAIAESRVLLRIQLHQMESGKPVRGLRGDQRRPPLQATPLDILHPCSCKEVYVVQLPSTVLHTGGEDVHVALHVPVLVCGPRPNLWRYMAIRFRPLPFVHHDCHPLRSPQASDPRFGRRVCARWISCSRRPIA